MALGFALVQSVAGFKAFSHQRLVTRTARLMAGVSISSEMIETLVEPDSSDELQANPPPLGRLKAPHASGGVGLEGCQRIGPPFLQRKVLAGLVLVRLVTVDELPGLTLPPRHDAYHPLGGFGPRGTFEEDHHEILLLLVCLGDGDASDVNVAGAWVDADLQYGSVYDVL